MRKTLCAVIFLALLIAGDALAQTDNRVSNEPIQNLIQASLDHHSAVLQKDKAVSAYLSAFLPLWKQTLSQLFSQDATESRLESFFDQNYNVTRKAVSDFDKLKPPSVFKDFHDVFTRGLQELSDWCMDMRDRIHYAKTPYQKEAYMKKIEGFRTNWYDTFFGDALDELTSEMSIFITSHWKEEMDPSRMKALNQNPAIKKYLTNYYKITADHLKAAEENNKKAQENREKNKGDTDPRQYYQDLKQELSELKSTKTKLEKAHPPDPFKDFHALEIAVLDARIRGTQLVLDIQKANEDNALEEKIQALIYQRNQAEEEAQRLKSEADNAYLEALKSF